MNKQQNKIFFEKVVLQFLGFEYSVFQRKNGCFALFHKEYGWIDIYPNKQRLLIRKSNTWKSNAFDWINENLLTEKFK
ncbi:hypothetical protein [Chryseobacterium indologenes]|uniref:hypothetical protein n=1 Tax=Chryseobacterium indologenes TaxID=253 RepID=UPI0007649A33|nr:hypothetical protein [Chryseobacterium indologenes]